jgi:uncharacterized membrane protein
MTSDDRLMRFLGWLSFGLGIPPTLQPGGFLRALGIKDTPPRRAVAVTIVGMREFAAAGGLLYLNSPAWLWGRVGGDILDLTMLGNCLRNRSSRDPRRTAAALSAVAAITAVDTYAAITRSRTRAMAETVGTTTIIKPPQEVYDRWRQLSSLPAFMAHLDEVRVTGERTSHWRTVPVGGRCIEWDAEITEDVPGQRIAWRSTDNADVWNEGTVSFREAPGGRGTEVHVRIRYAMPGGRLGQLMARLLGEDPRQQLDDDLRRFKQVVETGEVVRSEGAPAGKRARHEFPQHPARPLAAGELEALRQLEEVGV